MRYSLTTGFRRIPTEGSRSIRCIRLTRRQERRQDLIDELGKHYRISEVVDYSSSEEEWLYLEGTGKSRSRLRESNRLCRALETFEPGIGAPVLLRFRF